MQGPRAAPEVFHAKDWLGRVKYPSPARSPLGVIRCHSVGDVRQEAPHNERQQYSVAPGAGVPYVQVVPPRLHLKQPGPG